MLETAEELCSQGKKSLESHLRERAYEEVKESLKEQGIDIVDVSDEDVESLVALKVQDMTSNLKGFGGGIIFTLALTALTGV